jgi:rod shape determining protein RodA
MRPHQQNRIMTFLGITNDLSLNYNVNQSKTAIGSGGFFGKGYLQGSHIRYGLVPEKHTDFIFCTIGEEFGFLGSAVVLVILLLFIFRLMRMGDNQRETFGRVYCYSVASILLFHTLVNVGMTIGLVPVMGIPLPLISYGGSSLLSFSMMIFIAFAFDAQTSREVPMNAVR